MDVEAIAKRIAQDHGVTVLEKDVIETLEKLKAASMAAKTTANTSSNTSSNTPSEKTSTPTEQPPNTVPIGSAPVQTPSDQSKPGSEPVPDKTKPVTEHVNAAQNESIKLVIPVDVKPLPIDFIDDLIRQNYNHAGIETILKANHLSASRGLISSRMKVIKPLITVQSSSTKPASTETERVITNSEQAHSGAEQVISPPTGDTNTPSVKTSENTGDSDISGTNVVAQAPTTLQTSSAPSQTPLPTDPTNIITALQQFLASYKQPSGTVPAASEQVNESDSSHMIPISG